MVSTMRTPGLTMNLKWVLLITHALRDHYPKDDLVLGRLWKRIWWTCFVSYIQVPPLQP
jgi:hypothetical protein